MVTPLTKKEVWEITTDLTISELLHLKEIKANGLPKATPPKQKPQKLPKRRPNKSQESRTPAHEGRLATLEWHALGP